MRTMLGMAAMLGPDGLAAVKDVTKLGAPQTSTVGAASTPSRTGPGPSHRTLIP